MHTMTYNMWETLTEREQTQWLEEHTNNNQPMKNSYASCVNDADYSVQPKHGNKRLRCPAYIAWANMIKRVYSAEYNNNHPSYKGVSLCAEWHSFKVFRQWWLKYQVDSWNLDKDLLTNSKIYSPETCIYIPQWLNKFTTDHAVARGALPVGVTGRPNNMYQARCMNPILGKRESLGCFSNPQDAYQAWLTRKYDHTHALKPAIDTIDLRLYPRILEVISAAV